MVKNIIIFVLCLLLFVMVFVSIVIANDRWVAGKSGKHCYIEGEANKNIKFPMYFDSYEECLQFLNKQ